METETVNNSDQPFNPGKSRAGKRERARLRLRQKNKPTSSAPLPVDQPHACAARGDLGMSSRMVRGKKPTAKDKEPVSRVSEILEEMGNTSAFDAFRSVLLDPEDGFPDDAELTEIYLRYERGLPLTGRQQIWLDATSDISTRPYVVLDNQDCLPPPRPASCQPILAAPFYYRPILGCGEWASCEDCRHRYNLPSNYTPPPPEGRPANASEFLRRFFDGGKKLVEDLRRMKRQQGADAVLQQLFDDKENGKEEHNAQRNATMSEQENATMSEQEALTTIYMRLVTATMVSEFNLRRALQVAVPHCRPWSLSRQGLTDQVTWIRRRLAIEDSVQVRLLEGEETEATLESIRSFGLIVSLTKLGTQISSIYLLH